MLSQNNCSGMPLPKTRFRRQLKEFARSITDDVSQCCDRSALGVYKSNFKWEEI